MGFPDNIQFFISVDKSDIELKLAGSKNDLFLLPVFTLFFQLKLFGYCL